MSDGGFGMIPGALVAKRGLLRRRPCWRRWPSSPERAAPARQARRRALPRRALLLRRHRQARLARRTSSWPRPPRSRIGPARRPRAGIREGVGLHREDVAVGTGQALTMGQQETPTCSSSTLPRRSRRSWTRGWGVDRRLVAHNYFWIVGPASDPAGISGMTSAVDAFTKIAASGATFVSRGDNSGRTRRSWPSGSPPGSHRRAAGTRVGPGMGATLQIASEKTGYTLTDTATFLSSQANLALEALVRATRRSSTSTA